MRNNHKILWEAQNIVQMCIILNLDVVITFYFSFLRVTADYLLASLAPASERWP